MKLLKFGRKQLEPTELIAKRILLKTPTIEHYAAWADIRGSSAEFLQPYEPSWRTDELTRGAFRGRLRKQQSDLASGRGITWYLFDRNDPKCLMGGIALSNIRRGVADTATMGYWMGEYFAGKGFMKEAVYAVCKSAFQHHKLHRVEAATILKNERSQGLLISCGFSKEGTARKYLKINGEWMDHILFAKLSED